MIIYQAHKFLLRHKFMNNKLQKKLFKGYNSVIKKCYIGLKY